MTTRTPTYSPKTLLSITCIIIITFSSLQQCTTTTTARFSQAYPSGLTIQTPRPSYTTVSTLADSERVSLNQVDYLTGSPDRRKLVPVVLGVMSKCPDAQICEDVFDKVLAEVADKVDILLTYIGEIDPSAEYGVRCRHGNIECKGDIQQLCYRNRFPKLHDWWGFIQCENYAGLARVGDEELAKSCARVNGHDWDSDVKDCTTGSQGRQLLESSIEHAKQLRIRRSCSIFINHKLICIRDGVWKNCDDGHGVADFVKYIEHEFDLINHPSRAEQTTV
ncbi:hypothetical protein PSTG_08237 [Puccinia striiformis f. sp. tritici PST-78]|uniref:Gamma interferon inducible lysosomal thiol reductase GILT n=1 Tax=Puccinia striiformis f. sp. tritici PST-78 TaxID=1165861 RepID=A0A0L0VGX6_9BASI|nr:hypothetical protein PSTG_08237 [Puccinia striiformis f. sp. tritici PST-78]